MSRHKLYWIFQIAGWSFYGIIQLSLYSVQFQVDGLFVFGELLQITFIIAITHLFRIYILRNNWVSIKWVYLLPNFFLATLFFSIIHYCFLILVQYLIGNLNPLQDFNKFSILANMLQSMVLFWIWALLYVSFLYFERYNRSFKYEVTIKDIELNNLKSQLNPHFIFNALNSIRALIDEDPVKSKVAITQLSNILRNILRTQPQELVPFSEELATVKDYLSLEGIRYEERLETIYKIDAASNYFQIPPLMLQTLVENGIKHGIAKLKNGGIIALSAKKTATGLSIQIRNSGRYEGTDVSVGGYGLSNTRKRLALIYGGKASLHIENEKEGFVLTEIIIPESIINSK
jgi:two-component system, LytTR family, sensor kinase